MMRVRLVDGHCFSTRASKLKAYPSRSYPLRRDAYRATQEIQRTAEHDSNEGTSSSISPEDSAMERFLASHVGKCVVLLIAVIIIVAFGYHVVHSLYQAGRARAPSNEMMHTTPGPPTDSLGPRR
jgi:hypothetical protein